MLFGVLIDEYWRDCVTISCQGSYLVTVKFSQGCSFWLLQFVKICLLQTLCFAYGPELLTHLFCYFFRPYVIDAKLQ